MICWDLALGLLLGVAVATLELVGGLLASSNGDLVVFDAKHGELWGSLGFASRATVGWRLVLFVD